MITIEALRAQAHAAACAAVDRALADPSLDLNDDTVRAIAQGAEQGIERSVALQSHFGKFYTSAKVCQVLNVTKQAVSKKVSAHKLLRVTTSDGKSVFPAFQFVGNAVEPHIEKLVSILLSNGMDGWSALYWLTSPLPGFGGKTAVEMVYLGQGDEKLKLLALSDSSQWVEIPL